MTKLEFVAENGNIRIDKYIADNEPSLTRTAAAKLIERRRPAHAADTSPTTVAPGRATPRAVEKRQSPRTVFLNRPLPERIRGNPVYDAHHFPYRGAVSADQHMVHLLSLIHI